MNYFSYDCIVNYIANTKWLQELSISDNELKSEGNDVFFAGVAKNSSLITLRASSELYNSSSLRDLMNAIIQKKSNIIHLYLKNLQIRDLFGNTYIFNILLKFKKSESKELGKLIWFLPVETLGLGDTVNVSNVKKVTLPILKRLSYNPSCYPFCY